MPSTLGRLDAAFDGRPGRIWRGREEWSARALPGATAGPLARAPLPAAARAQEPVAANIRRRLPGPGHAGSTAAGVDARSYMHGYSLRRPRYHGRFATVPTTLASGAPRGLEWWCNPQRLALAPPGAAVGRHPLG